MGFLLPTLPQGLPDLGGEGGTAEGRAGQLAEQPGERAAGVHQQRGMRQFSPGVQPPVRSGSRYDNTVCYKLR